MKCIKVELNKNPIITIETKRFLLKPKIKQYQSIGILVGKYNKWVELPNKTLVEDLLSFQLDTWLEEYKKLDSKI